MMNLKTQAGILRRGLGAARLRLMRTHTHTRALMLFNPSLLTWSPTADPAGSACSFPCFNLSIRLSRLRWKEWLMVSGCFLFHPWISASSWLLGHGPGSLLVTAGTARVLCTPSRQGPRRALGAPLGPTATRVVRAVYRRLRVSRTDEEQCFTG